MSSIDRSNGFYDINKKRAYTLKANITEIHQHNPVNCTQILRVARGTRNYDPDNLWEQLFGTYGDVPFLVFQGIAIEVKINEQYIF